MFFLLLIGCFLNITKGFNQLSFSGGGSFGAVEMGIIKKINELEKKHYDIYTGISVGGLNAGFLSYFKDLTLGIKEGEALYTKLKTRMVYEAYPQTGFSIFNTLPLFKTLTDILNTMPNDPIINTLIGSTNLYTGNLDIFNFGEIDRKERPTLLMATSAIPVIFPPITFRNNMYIDGGTLSNELLDVIHSDSYLNITFITPSNSPNVNTTPIICLKDVVMRTIQIVTKNYNDPLSKVNQNCKIQYGEINKYFVDNSLLNRYNILNFDKGQELIDIGYKYMEHKKYILC
jgi:predicted acylesterase/phospholipase RssA